MQYETYYVDGGHGGPHESLEAAWEYAKNYMKGSRWTTCVEIRPRNSKQIGGYQERNQESMYLFKGQLNCLYSSAHL